jgi:hypothetical protein
MGIGAFGRAASGLQRLNQSVAVNGLNERSWLLSRKYTVAHAEGMHFQPWEILVGSIPLRFSLDAFKRRWFQFMLPLNMDHPRPTWTLASMRKLESDIHGVYHRNEKTRGEWYRARGPFSLHPWFESRPSRNSRLRLFLLGSPPGQGSRNEDKFQCFHTNFVSPHGGELNITGNNSVRQSTSPGTREMVFLICKDRPSGEWYRPRSVFEDRARLQAGNS